MSEFWDEFLEKITWQNNLACIGFLVSAASTIVLVVFFSLVLYNQDSGDPGGIATPILLCCLVLVIILISGIFLEAHSVKEKLPNVTTGRVVIAFVALVFFFGLKSFILGWGIGVLMVLSVFIARCPENGEKEDRLRLRCNAVCSAVICLVIAEAIRRSGGYDTGGVSRYVLNAYACFSFFLSGVMVLSTVRRLPLVTKLACAGYALLALHSACTMIVGMKNLLDDTFAERSQPETEYCIKSTISSPVGLSVEAFRKALNPPYVHTTSTTTTIPLPTTIPSGCYDYIIHEEVIEDGDENSTNRTITTRSRTVRICRGGSSIFDQDGNTTTSTSTTSTSTTSTSTTSTSTTSTSTTSTTTTSTTTTSTTTTSTTTSTTTITTTTFNNDTTTVTFLTTTATTTAAALLETSTCLPGTDATAVSGAGSWGIAVFTLGGAWASSLLFALVIFAPSFRVHPEHNEDEDDDDDEKEPLKPKRDWGKTCATICKLLFKFVVKSTETLIGTAFFAITGIILVVTGGTQLPKERPPCFAEPSSVARGVAWAEEPAKRFAIIWCELGPISAVLLPLLSYCCFMLSFSILLRRAMRYAGEDRRARNKRKARELMTKKKRDADSRKLSTMSGMSQASHGGHSKKKAPQPLALEDDEDKGFQVKNMIPKEPLPDPAFQDLDGRIFDV